MVTVVTIVAGVATLPGNVPREGVRDEKEDEGAVVEEGEDGEGGEGGVEEETATIIGSRDTDFGEGCMPNETHPKSPSW